MTGRTEVDLGEPGLSGSIPDVDSLVASPHDKLTTPGLPPMFERAVSAVLARLAPGTDK